MRDLRNALAAATDCKKQSDGTWKVKGRDLDGEELSMIVTIAPRAIVIVL